MRLLYFAAVRDAIGLDEETVSPPDTVLSVADLVDWLVRRGERYALAFNDRGRLRAAVDQVFAPLDAAIGGASEIALFPPVTGG